MNIANGMETILVADDEKTVRALVMTCLDGYCLLEADDGAKALDMALSDHPDLVILDVMMPKMDGYAVCQRLKTNPLTKSIPIVMLTGLGFELNAKLSRNLGADAYITKPFSPAELKRTVSGLLIEKTA